MALELIVNVLLFACSIFFYIYVGATMPKSAQSDLGAEQWPQALLFILILAICWNLRNYFKRNKMQDVKRAFGQFVPDVLKFLKSKLFIGMVMIIVMAQMYEPIGFLSTSLLFMLSYGLLLGQRNPLTLVLSSLLITLLLYIGFAVFLGVMLPRGNVGFLRNIALFLESIVQRITS